MVFLHDQWKKCFHRRSIMVYKCNFIIILAVVSYKKWCKCWQHPSPSELDRLIPLRVTKKNQRWNKFNSSLINHTLMQNWIINVHNQCACLDTFSQRVFKTSIKSSTWNFNRLWLTTLILLHYRSSRKEKVITSGNKFPKISWAFKSERMEGCSFAFHLLKGKRKRKMIMHSIETGPIFVKACLSLDQSCNKIQFGHRLFKCALPHHFSE